MKRRNFIKNTLATSALLSLGGISLSSFTDKKPKKITILHTNDTHSHIEAFPADHPLNPNMGGVARRATLVSKIREEEDNVLLLDAGDMFQGTPYFNYYGGELEFKLMNMLGYDVATIGNHEFDNGLEGILAQLPNAQFDIVNANYDFSNTILKGMIKPYKVIEKDGVRIGVFGLGIELEGLVDKKSFGETIYLDPIEVATTITNTLRNEENCDVVICLSHLGFKFNNEPDKICDLILAEQTEGIDVIIGGHTHTFLDKPVIKKNKVGKEVLVNQVGAYGINLGKIDLYLDDTNKKIGHEGISIKI
ncbi:metallophosphatase [Flavobacterium agricola]|uniref:Metallophosphatase n=1 Tax=Flavobacterium agricola TaxID=2870839 RepID=A0ABY6M0S7_9FLAO|nr:metallophosphatase [Flavobacterium agricola]UYW02164.1 metallophosphatase [Flavobacterium agricola]